MSDSDKPLSIGNIPYKRNVTQAINFMEQEIEFFHIENSKTLYGITHVRYQRLISYVCM